MIRCLFIIAVIATVFSCKKGLRTTNKFADTVLVRIADFQDRRLGDSLSFYLENSNPSYRREAALAYASIQDSTYAESVGKLLYDNDRDVRQAAAFALGQILSRKSEQLLHKSCLAEKDDVVLAEMVEAYGKVSKSWKLDLTSDDTITRSGLAWSYYRMGIRDLSDKALTAKAAEFLKSTYDHSTRLGASHYFARGAKDFDQYQNAIIQSAKYDISPEVRMASVLSLKKVKSDSSRAAAKDIFRHDSDHRVRINAVRVLQNFSFPQTKDILIEALQDSSINVGIAASEIIKETITKEFWIELNRIARSTKNWRIQANLYEAALTVSDHKELAEEIRSVYNKSTNPYQKASLLIALQHSIMSYGFVQEQLFKNTEPIIKSSAATSLLAMNYRKDFDASLRSSFAKIYKAAIMTGDAAVIGTIASALADSTLNYKVLINDFSFLHEARNKLSLPRDFEAIAPLETAIAYFEGRKISPVKNAFNHAIPWNRIKKIPHDQRAIIRTSQGDITIRLFVEEAPGSVANFVTLAMNKYYDGKFFHRVVPNFVVQAGCVRGDGWGSEAYSIRSEFSHLRYKRGTIGMASAGKDTEGTQWFITHSPTPHLDGRYTIFAEVLEGMEVVDEIQVGDSIISIQIIDGRPL